MTLGGLRPDRPQAFIHLIERPRDALKTCLGAKPPAIH